MTINSAAYDLAQIVDGDSSFSLSIGTNLFVGVMPKEPEGLLVLFQDAPSEPPEALLDSSTNYERPAVQMMVRSAVGGYVAAQVLAGDLKRSLHNLSDVTISTTRYIGIWATSEPFPIGQDERERTLFVVNFRIHRTS